MSWLRVDGNVPVRDFDWRLMVVMRLELSQVMPSQLQKVVVDDQDGGVGEMEVESWSIMDESSAVVRVVRRRRKMVVVMSWWW